MLEVHSHVALKRHCIVRSQLREKMMKTALIFFLRSTIVSNIVFFLVCFDSPVPLPAKG